MLFGFLTFPNAITPRPAAVAAGHRERRAQNTAAHSCSMEPNRALKSKHVLLCSEFTNLGRHYIKLLSECELKTLTVCSRVGEACDEQPVVNIVGDVTSIQSMEEVFSKTVEKNKRIDVVINSKEIVVDSNWEEAVTKDINSLICSTLLAMKHMGTMNSGRGGTVVNAVTISGDDEYPAGRAGLHSLLNDLDRSFGDPYYSSSTGVRILTVVRGSGPPPQGPASASSRNEDDGDDDDTGVALLRVLRTGESDLGKAVPARMDQFEISVGD